MKHQIQVSTRHILYTIDHFYIDLMHYMYVILNRKLFQFYKISSFFIIYIEPLQCCFVII